jgi:hypothetical protein
MYINIRIEPIQRIILSEHKSRGESLAAFTCACLHSYIIFYKNVVLLSLGITCICSLINISENFHGGAREIIEHERGT